MLLSESLVMTVFLIRKLRRFFGLPVLDLTNATGSIKSAVREMEAKPKPEDPKE